MNLAFLTKCLLYVWITFVFHISQFGYFWVYAVHGNVAISVSDFQNMPLLFNKHVDFEQPLYFQCNSGYTLKNKGASKGSSNDAIEEPVLVPQRNIQSKVL